MAAAFYLTLNAKLQRAWDNIQAEIRRLSVEMRPKQKVDAISPVFAEDGVRFDFSDICLKVTEKAGLSTTNLYVAIEGSILFVQEAAGDVRSITFAARAGYFREVETGHLKHVMGIHYDHVRTDVMRKACGPEGCGVKNCKRDKCERKDFGHPTYHAQIKPMTDLVNSVNKNFNKTYPPIPDQDNCVLGALSNVRLPSANMDPLCIILQVLGDHVVNDKSTKTQQTRFKNALKHVNEFFSSITAAACLNAAVDNRCFRSPHWYVT